MNEPTKKCKHCQSTIDAKAKVCPVCRRKQGHGCLIPILIALGIILLLFIVLMISAPESPNNETKHAENNITEQQAEESKPEALGDFDVIIKDAVITRNFEDKDCLLVSFDFTNNSDSNQSFETATVTRAYQNGVQLDTTVGVYESENHENDLTDNAWKTIQPGTTIDVKEAFLLNDMSPVDIEVNELFSIDDKKITQTFDLQ